MGILVLHNTKEKEIIMKIIAKLAKEVFDSGKAIGFKTNITNVTGWLKKHPKGVGEQIGNALSGKAKSVNDTLIKGDMYDKLFAHLDDVAKQYPDATVQVAAKNAKKGGYKVAKVTVKNGDNTLYKQAVSITDDGTIKTKAQQMGSEISESVDRQGVRAIVTSETGTVKASYSKAQKTGQVELSHASGQIATANYVNKGGNTIRGGASYEVADDLVSGQMYYNGHEVSFLGDTDGLKKWAVRANAQRAKQRKEIEPLMLSLLRPLRDRFNTAIDLFKYNGKTDFERFVSKEELYKTVKELQGEVVSFEKLKQAGNLTPENASYLAQIKSDIGQAERLIEIHC